MIEGGGINSAEGGGTNDSGGGRTKSELTALGCPSNPGQLFKIASRVLSPQLSWENPFTLGGGF